MKTCSTTDHLCIRKLANYHNAVAKVYILYKKVISFPKPQDPWGGADLRIIRP